MLQRIYVQALFIAVIATLTLMPARHASAQQNWLNTLGSLMNGMGVPSSKISPTLPTHLTQNQMSQGIKEALSKGVRVAIDQLGRRNGFLHDRAVKIPLPNQLKQVADLLRQFHQGRLADQFVATMNHAAEQAVPQAATIFAEAIRRMTLQDAQRIVQGPDDAATQYFKRTSGPALAKRLRPIIAQATNKVGVTSAYKKMIAEAGPLAQLLGGDVNLDTYITQKALDGLFYKIAVEEKAIRTQPLARTTALLKKVFANAQ